MNITTLYITKTSGKLNNLETVIERAYARAKETVARHLNLDICSVDVIIVDDPTMTIKSIGIGGFTPNRNLCYIYLDPSISVDEDELYYTLCHELHHAKRYEAEGYGSTLFDSIIFEGLATSFEAEISNGQSHIVRELLERTNTNSMLTLQAEHFTDVNFDHYAWFIADPSGKLPTWAGYEMGYYIIQQYSEMTHKKASELTLEASDTFQKFVRDALGARTSSSEVTSTT